MRACMSGELLSTTAQRLGNISCMFGAVSLGKRCTVDQGTGAVRTQDGVYLCKQYNEPSSSPSTLFLPGVLL